MVFPIPQTFRSKKQRILQALSTPAESYSDKSPKGSVDEAIHPLIDQINGSEGLVTTSSCAGRVSVYLEGPKSESEAEQIGGEAGPNEDGERKNGERKGKLVPGGKGGGKFLFVSHEPLELDSPTTEWLLGPETASKDFPDADSRLVRFSFEPMVCLPLGL